MGPHSANWASQSSEALRIEEDGPWEAVAVCHPRWVWSKWVLVILAGLTTQAAQVWSVSERPCAVEEGLGLLRQDSA